jgi:hypothetical protein
VEIERLDENHKQRSGEMKRNWILLAVIVVFSLFLNLSLVKAQCPQDPNDLGICDTLYVETFDCDHVYQATGGYDSVRVAVYVTHDSNTFYWEGGSRWVQDSITIFVIPLKFSKVGCADSVILPTTGTGASAWNNKRTDRSARSIFRDLYNPHTGVTDSNRYAYMVSDLGWDPWTVTVNFKRPDSAMVSMIAPGFGKWWEGSRVLLFTYTFLVYIDPGSCQWCKICLDSTYWHPNNNLAFSRYDAVNYVPRHFLPTCDSVSGVKWIEGATDGENRPNTFFVSQNYPNPFNPQTNFKFSLPQASHVKIDIFNILGQRIKTLVDEDMKAGVYLVDWDGKDEKGVEISSGVYFYRVTAGDFSDIRKMIFMK